MCFVKGINEEMEVLDSRLMWGIVFLTHLILYILSCVFVDLLPVTSIVDTQQDAEMD